MDLIDLRKSKWKHRREQVVAKTKDEIKSSIQDIMDTLGITHAKFLNYEIVSETKIKQKKKMVNTGETYESYAFTLKEIN